MAVNYGNSHRVYTEKQTPIGRSPVYNSVKNEYEVVSDRNKLIARYPTHKRDCSELRIDGFHRSKVNEVIEKAKAKKGRKPAWLKEFNKTIR
jgi:hypothetical protein